MNTLRIFPLQGHRKDIRDIAEQLTEALPKDINDAYLEGVDDNEKLTYYFSKNCAWGVIGARKYARVEFYVSSDFAKNTTLYVSSQETLDNFIKKTTRTFDNVCNETNYKVNI